MRRIKLVHYLIWFIFSVSAFAANVPKVVTSDVRGIRVEYGNFGGAVENTDRCAASPCTVYRASGSWISSVTRASAGIYTINITAGIFGTQPACVARGVEDGTGPVVCGKASATNTTSFTIACWRSTGVAADASVEVICVGPR